MNMKDSANALAGHPFCRGMKPAHLELLGGMSSLVCFDAGKRIFSEGDTAREFYLIVSGRVALEVDVPGSGVIEIQTLGPGEALGWSWLFEPRRWHFGARALVGTELVKLDAGRILEACEADTGFGYELTRRVASVMLDRLQATRMQLMDLYAARD